MLLYMLRGHLLILKMFVRSEIKFGLAFAVSISLSLLTVHVNTTVVPLLDTGLEG